MPLAAGARLGPYEIVAPLGAGGMGEVYRARDTRLNRVVAIKILPADLAGDPRRRERFRREALAVASFTHPHICNVHDVGAHQGLDFLVMEYLPGKRWRTVCFAARFHSRMCCESPSSSRTLSTWRIARASRIGI